MLDISQMRYIVEVEKAGSISKAAANLFVSQPYISRLIKEIENSMSIVIFTRGKKGMEVTPEGEEFIYYAKTVLSQYDLMQQAFHPTKKNNTQLRIAVQRSSHVFEAFIEFLYKIQMENPPTVDNRLLIDFNEVGLMRTIDLVESKKADLGVINCSRNQYHTVSAIASRRNIQLQEISRQKLYVVVSKNHPLARRGTPVRLSELYEYGTVCYGDRNESSFNAGLDDTEKGPIDFDKCPQVIRVYDRGSQLNVLSYTDCFIIGIRSFEAQSCMYNIVSLPIAEEPGVDITDNYAICSIVTLTSKQLSEPAKSFIASARAYFARIQDVET